MNKIHRRLCIMVMLFALLAGCVDDEDDPPASTSGTTTTLIPPVTTRPGATTTSTTAPSGRTTTSTPFRGVTDGAVCPQNGANGVTNSGIAVVCMPIAGGQELRWRPA